MTDHIVTNLTLRRSSAGSDPIALSILSFARLKPGWHYGEGVPVSSSAVQAALNLLSALRIYGAEAVEVFPDVDGGILVSGYNGADNIDALVRPDGRISIEQDTHNVAHDAAADLSVSEAISDIKRLAWRSKRSFGSSTRNTSVIGVRRSEILLSRIYPMGVEYLSSNARVFKIGKHQNVRILGPSIVPISPEIPPYSGASTYNLLSKIVSQSKKPREVVMFAITTSRD